MIVLGIETSCDETAAAVVRDGRHVLSSVVSSQFHVHRPYRGVVPELASRAHVETVQEVVAGALANARKTAASLDGVAVTAGPGLAGSLLVGAVAAETLAWLHGLPCLGVNHIEGHVLSALVAHPRLVPPFLALIVSGGHTELIDVPAIGRYRRLGATRDDAAGEAYDKVAKLLGLGFPGGPRVDRLARKGRPDAFAFSRPWLEGTRDFSFSGLKTAALYKVRELGPRKLARGSARADLCASFQAAVVEVLVGKTLRAAGELGRGRIVVGGGVAANSELRRRFTEAARSARRELFIAPAELCTDNAAMIAAAGCFMMRARRSQRPRVDPGLVIRSWGAS